MGKGKTWLSIDKVWRNRSISIISVQFNSWLLDNRLLYNELKINLYRVQFTSLHSASDVQAWDNDPRFSSKRMRILRLHFVTFSNKYANLISWNTVRLPEKKGYWRNESRVHAFFFLLDGLQNEPVGRVARKRAVEISEVRVGENERSQELKKNYYWGLPRETQI